MITIFSDPLKHPISTYLDISRPLRLSNAQNAACQLAALETSLIGIKGAYAYWLVVCGYIFYSTY